MKRRYLTPRERRDMHAVQDGKCAVCGDSIAINGCVAEHWNPVALGNGGKPDCLLCVPCALRKTNGTPATTAGSDISNIAKAKRRAKKHAEFIARMNGERSAEKPKRNKLPSRGFQKGHRPLRNRNDLRRD